jgi:hypothetical protein
MAFGGRARNAPCFCGSGRKLKHCCARDLSAVRTWRHPRTSCRWRFYHAHGNHERYASELAEHICTGERVFIARGTPYGTSWLIDDDPISLLALLARLPGAHYRWAIEQTLTALSDRGLDQAGSDTEGAEDIDDAHFAEIRELPAELLSLAHASDALAATLASKGISIDPAELALRDHPRLRLAS